MQRNMKKQVMAAVLGVSLLASVGTYVREASATQLNFVNLTQAIIDAGFDEATNPFGIDCGSAAYQFAYVAVDDTDVPPGPEAAQGLLGRIDKNTHDATIFTNPDIPLFRALGLRQGFYSIASNPVTGELYVNERLNGKLWRFDPNTAGNGPDNIAGTTDDTGWTPIPLFQMLDQSIVPSGLPDPFFEYGVRVVDGDDFHFADGYTHAPQIVRAHLSNLPDDFVDMVIFSIGDGSVVFANGFVWVGLHYIVGTEETIDAGVPAVLFKGVARINPTTLQVDRFPLPGDPVSTGVTDLVVDSVYPNIIWITDFNGNQVYKFDTALNLPSVTEIIPLTIGNSPRGIVTDANSLYVALNEPSLGVFPNSTILKITKADTSQQTPIDTGAQNDVEGTFSVFIAGWNKDILVWTDGSKHVGTIDLLTGLKSTFDTETFFNHFACEVMPDEVWFSGKGSIKVGILSRISGGGPVGPSSNGVYRGSKRDDDRTSPTVEGYYWTPEAPSPGDDLTIYFRIIDDVMVENATLFYYDYGDNPNKAHYITMENMENGWFTISIDGSEVKEPGMSFFVVAMDPSANPRQSDTITVTVKQGETSVVTKASNTNLPTHVLEAIKLKPTYPAAKLEVISMNNGNRIKSFQDKIIIRNVGDMRADNIRIVLSSEISKSFRLSEQAIKSIEPNGNVTITLELNGNPNKDMVGGLVGYSGELMVMAEHNGPIILPVIIGGQGSSYMSDYMQKVASMAALRYSKLSLLNNLLHAGSADTDIDLSASSGVSEVTSASDELVIKNTGERQLNNVRIVVSKLGNAFLLEKSNIVKLGPHESVTVQLIPMISSAEYSPRDYMGEIIVVADNGLPQTIPVRIAGGEEKDSMDEFGVMTMSGETISTTLDKITIRNYGERNMDSVKIIMSDNLQRIFALSDTSFQHIGPHDEVTVELMYRAGDLQTLMQDYSGEIKVVSEHHNMHVIPVDIHWKRVDSKHFTVYTRGEESVAKQLTDMLEGNYQKFTSRLGELKSRTVIYMASLDEMNVINNGRAYYSYGEDAIFIPDDNIQYDALKEFVYRLVINSYPSYYNMKQFTFDRENWLLDGLTSYIASTVASKEMTENTTTFVTDKTSFQWYGYGSDAQYGATHSFFKYLESRYGSSVIDNILHHMGTGMVSNHKCNTVESCAVLQAVYDSMGLDMDNKRYTLSFKNLWEDWVTYVKSNSDQYSSGIDKPAWNPFAYHIE